MFRYIERRYRYQGSRNLMEGVEAKAVNSAGFIAAIRERLEKRLV